MIEQAVVSCPHCVRQYEIDETSDHLVAQCDGCKAHFVLVVPRLTAPAEDDVVLEKGVEPYTSYLGEACEALARHACAWMAGRGDAISPSSLIEFVEKITSDRVCEQLRYEYKTPYRVCREGGEAKAADLAQEYFINKLAHKSKFARFMLRSAFSGVLGGIVWPEPGATAAITTPPAKDIRTDGSGVSTTPLPPRLKRFRWLSGKD